MGHLLDLLVLLHLGGRVTLTSAAPADPTLLSLHFGSG